MKHKKIAVVVFLIGLAIAAIFFAPLVFKPKPGPAQACFKSNCFEVEVAKTQAEREQGLMFREHLDSNKGMLFVFDKEANYPFWMKNTLIPLDMVWINQNREIVYIEADAQPCKQVECPLMNPFADAKYVLELNGGGAKAIGLKLGDKAYFTNLGF